MIRYLFEVKMSSHMLVSQVGHVADRCLDMAKLTAFTSAQIQ